MLHHLRYHLIVGLLALTSLGIFQQVRAQTTAHYTLTLRGVPLQEALEQLVRLTEIDLVYPSGLVKEQRVYCAEQNVPAEALLRCVLADSGLDYIRSSGGTFILIESLAQPPRHGHLAGRVVDGATGEPLPFANIFLAEAATGTASDEAGLFSFASVLSGRHRIVVTYVGYETAVDSVYVPPGDRQRVQIALHAKPLAMEPVVIDGLAQRLPSSTLGLGTFDAATLASLSTSSTPDVARGAARLPGIAIQQPIADLHIQGGGAGEHLTLLDGVPVRDPVSLGRHLSAFSPLAIERVTVHKAGFGAEHGSHLSGVVAIDQEVGGAEHAGVSVDPVSVNGRLQGHFALPGTHGGAAMLAARHSIWPAYKGAGGDDLLRNWHAVDPMLASLWIREDVSTSSLVLLRQQPEVAFSDLHAAFRLNLSPFRTLHASLYRARNRLASELISVNTAPTSSRLLLTHDDYDWTNWAGQVRHDWLLGARSVGSVQMQGSWHDSRYSYQALHAPTESALSSEQLLAQANTLYPDLYAALGSNERNQIREVSLRATWSYSLTPSRHLDAGITATHVGSRFRFGNPFVAPFRHDAAAWEWAGYARGSLALGLSTILEPSLRLTYLPALQTAYFEPRLALRYDWAASRIGPYALRLAGGVHRQFVNTFELSSAGSTAVVPSVLFWLPVPAGLAPPRAYHLAGEALFMPHPAWTFRLESYLKAQPHLLTLDYAGLIANHPAVRPAPPPLVLDQSAFIASTHGRAYGGTARIERAGERLSGMASYTLSRAVRRFPGRFGERLVPVPWNAPHRLQLDAHIDVTSSIGFDLAWEGAWGRRWAFRQAYYDYLALRDTPNAFAPFDLSDPAAHRLAPYTVLDAGVSFAHTWHHITLHGRVFIVNMLNHRNAYDWSLEQEDSAPSYRARRLPGRYPVFMLRLGY